MLKQIFISLAIFTFLSAFSFAQETHGTDKKQCSSNCCSNHNSHSSKTKSYLDADSTQKHQDKHTDDKIHHTHKNMKSSKQDNSSIIHEGEIDLNEIDKNKDGKVYQDQMCWNVISDKPGECPKCGMTLKEVSLEKAKENLQKNNYKVK